MSCRREQSAVRKMKHLINVFATPISNDRPKAVHEIGHWHGLLHPFANLHDAADACDSSNENDFVSDTPAMKAESEKSFFTNTS